MAADTITPQIAAPVVLEYGQSAQPTSTSPRLVRALWLVVVLPAAITPFVHFTWSVSPAFVVAECIRMFLRGERDGALLLMLLALPFFLGIVLVLRRLRLVIHAGSTWIERVVTFSLAGATAVVTLTFFTVGTYLSLRDQSLKADELLLAAVGPAVIALGAAAVWWLRRRRICVETLLTVALHSAYLGNACVCLIAFKDNRQLGWWLTFAVGVVMVAHFAWTLMLSMLPGGFANRR